MTRPVPALLGGCAALALVCAGCSVPPAELRLSVQCGPLDQHSDSGDILIIMAQSVPTAEFIPCVRGLPPGWKLSDFAVRDGRSRFWVDPDGNGDRTVAVTLQRACDLRGATEVPSDQPGATRYVRSSPGAAGYQREAHYVYRGGCTTYTRRVDVAVALGFMTRQAIADGVRTVSGGRVELDPPGSATR
jgi:hypothetical protein